MADRDDKTEEATPRKLSKMREEGSVVKSADIAAAAVMFAGVIVLMAFGSDAAIGVVRMTERCFRLQDRPLEALPLILPALRQTALPILIAGFLAAVAAGVVQTRGLFSLKALALKPERLNPFPNLKSVVPSKKTAIELGKQFLKIAILGAVVYRLVSKAIPEFGFLSASGPLTAASTVASVVLALVVQGGATFVAIAVLDYFVAKKRFAEDAKMSKEEVRDEHHQREGRPEVKVKRRQKQRELAKARAVSDVKLATALVCNPTHIAIALRYDDATPAPVVLSKGVEEVALAMRAAARQHGVPIFENRPLARVLLRTAKIGRPIPVDLYEAVARVIARVMELRAS